MDNFQHLMESKLDQDQYFIFFYDDLPNSICVTLLNNPI